MIYIIKNTRSKNEIISFNKKFLVNYKELASEYEIPQYSETPNKVLKTAEELLSYCEENISEHHAIYWKSTVNSLMSEIFYTIDGYTIFGLSTDEETKCNFLFNEMSEFLDSDFGYVTVENPAPKNLDEFSTNFCYMLKKNEKYKDVIPDNKFQEEVIDKIQISEIENDRKLCYALLCWCQDINWPVAKKIVGLMSKADSSILPCVNTILKFDDENWNFCLQEFLIPAMKVYIN